MEQLSPIPPQSNEEGAKEQEMRHFGIIGGRGGPDVPFILSKIEGCFWLILSFSIKRLETQPDVIKTRRKYV